MNCILAGCGGGAAAVKRGAGVIKGVTGLTTRARPSHASDTLIIQPESAVGAGVGCVGVVSVVADPFTAHHLFERW